MRPKSFGESTNPRPKWCSQMRLTIERQRTRNSAIAKLKSRSRGCSFWAVNLSRRTRIGFGSLTTTGWGIEFMIMAARTLNGGTAENIIGRRNKFIPVQIASFFAVEFGLRDFNVTDEIPGARREKTQSQNSVRNTGIQDISRDLLLDELGIGIVIIDRTNYIVAIGPGIRTRFVFVVTASVRIANQIQPVPSPPFASPPASTSAMGLGDVESVGATTNRNCR